MRRKPNEIIIIVAGINSHGFTMELITMTDTTCKKFYKKIKLNLTELILTRFAENSLRSH